MLHYFYVVHFCCYFCRATELDLRGYWRKRNLLLSLFTCPLFLCCTFSVIFVLIFFPVNFFPTEILNIILYRKGLYGQ